MITEQAWRLLQALVATATCTAIVIASAAALFAIGALRAKSEAQVIIAWSAIAVFFAVIAGRLIG